MTPLGTCVLHQREEKLLCFCEPLALTTWLLGLCMRFLLLLFLRAGDQSPSSQEKGESYSSLLEEDMELFLSFIPVVSCTCKG